VELDLLIHIFQNKLMQFNKLKILIFLLVVGSIFYRYYFPEMPLNIMKRIIFYISLFVLLTLTFSGVPKKYFINKNWLLVFLFFLLFQTLHTFSYLLYENQLHTHAIIKSSISLVVFFLTVLFIYFLPMHLISKQLKPSTMYEYFYKAISVSFWIVVSANTIQQLYLFFPSIFDPIITIFSHTIEVTWSAESGREYSRFNWVDGSYIKSNFRLNGMSEEAAENVALIFIGFLPFLFSRLITNLKYNLAFTRELIKIFISILIFIIAKTSFGLLFAFISISILMFILLKYKIRLFLLLHLFLFLFLPLIIIFIDLNTILFNITKLFDLSVTSTNSRLAVTITLAKIFIHNMFFGVGNGALDMFIIQFLPPWTEGNHEISLWVESGHISPLSILLAHLATYGLFGVSIFIVFFYTIYKKIKIHYKSSASYYSSQLYSSYSFFILFMFLAMFFHIAWYKSIYMFIASLFLVLAINTTERILKK